MDRGETRAAIGTLGQARHQAQAFQLAVLFAANAAEVALVRHTEGYDY